MSIKKYTNIEGINNNTENEGQFLQADDLFIVSKTEIEETDFGNCKYDVMEVSIYDINNNEYIKDIINDKFKKNEFDMPNLL